MIPKVSERPGMSLKDHGLGRACGIFVKTHTKCVSETNLNLPLNLIMGKVIKYHSLSSEDLEKIRSLEGVKVLLTEHHPIHGSQQTDDLGNEINPLEYMHDVVIEILPGTIKEACTLQNFLDSLTPSGKDHRHNVYGNEYQEMVRSIKKRRNSSIKK